MTTPQDHELAEKIVSLLNQGTNQIDAKTAGKLLTARKEALARYQQKPTSAWMPHWATAGVNHASLYFEPFSHNLRAVLVLLALLGSLSAVLAWQASSQQGSEFADIDEGLLTDELPINAYLDKGFDSWLKRSSR